MERLESRRVLASFLVTSTADSVDPDDGVLTLREAITLANESAGLDSILFDNALAGPTAEISLTLGEILVTDSLRVTGPGEHRLAVDANQLSRIFRFESDPSSEFTLQGLTLAGGRTTGLNEPGGAVLFVSGGTLTLNLATLQDHATLGDDSHGGAVFAETGNVVVRGSRFFDSGTEGGNSSGGAVHVAAGAFLSQDSTFHGNYTRGMGSRGGAIFAGGSTASIRGTVITENATHGDSADGGAVYASDGATLQASQLSGNTTYGEDSDGGALFASTYLSLQSVDASSNTTYGIDSAGGAIAADSATVLIRNSSLTGNRTKGDRGYGGGMLAVRSNVTIQGTTVSGNAATGGASDGGGIAAFLSDLTVNAATIARNSTIGRGGGIAFAQPDQGSLLITNSIVAENIDEGIAPDLLGANAPLAFSIESSLIGDNRGTELSEASVPDDNGNLVGDISGQGVASPQLLPLMFTGITRLHPLAGTSPAIDAGSNRLVGAPRSDQRGEPFVRIAGPRVDMGAFEDQTTLSLDLVVTTALDEVDFDNNVVSLREAVMRANGTPGEQTITFDLPSEGVNVIDLTLGAMRIAGDTTILSDAGQGTVIDAQGRSRLFEVTEGSANLSLRDLVLRGGQTTASYAGGGAIEFLSAGLLSIDGVVLTDNHTRGDHASGGAIVVTRGAISIIDSNLDGNSTSGRQASGGAVSGGRRVQRRCELDRE